MNQKKCCSPQRKEVGDQGKFTPGTKIPIINPKNRPKKDPMMVGLLLAWNYKNAIIENEKKYLKNGGKFLIPIPKPILI